MPHRGMRDEKEGISGYDGHLRHQGQTITKPAIGGPGPPRGLALPPELLSTIHLSVINHSDPLREGWKKEKEKKTCFRMSNIVYPWKSQRKEHARFQAEWKQVEKLKCFHGCGDGQGKLFLVLFILLIIVYYFLSRQRLMFVFKGLRDDSTRAQLDLIVSDLHKTRSEGKLK